MERRVGQREEVYQDFLHLRFKAIDAEQAAPIRGLHIVCATRTGMPACTEQAGERAGETIITLSALRHTTKSLLFRRDTRLSFGDRNNVTLQFIHPDYLEHAIKLTANELSAAQRQITVVKLTKAEPCSVEPKPENMQRCRN